MERSVQDSVTRMTPGTETNGERNVLLRWLSQHGHGEELDHPKLAQRALAKLARAQKWGGMDLGGIVGSRGADDKDLDSLEEKELKEFERLEAKLQSERAAKTASLRVGVSIFPVFIMSDLVVHADDSDRGARKVGTEAGAGAGAGAVLPLLDKDSRTAVHGNTVLLVHSQGSSSSDPIRTYNRATQRWQAVSSAGPLTDATAMVAAGLTEAIAGVAAPYVQTAKNRNRGVVDLTWAAGSHPYELGDWPEKLQEDPHDAAHMGHSNTPKRKNDAGSVYAWLGRRTQLIARSHSLLENTRAFSAEIRTAVHSVMQALRMLHTVAPGDSAAIAELLSFTHAGDTSAHAHTRSSTASYTDEEFNQALKTFREQNTKKRAVSVSADAAARADVIIERSLAALAASRNKGAQVEAAESVLLLALRAHISRTEIQRSAVQSMHNGQPSSVPDGTFAAVVHRADFMHGHLQPYIDFLDTLDGLEATLVEARTAHADLIASLREALSACSISFQFVDSALHLSDGAASAAAGAGAGAAGMVADFSTLLERPERVKKQMLQPQKNVKEMGMGQLVWDYASGRSGEDYAPDALYKKFEKSTKVRTSCHVMSCHIMSRHVPPLPLSFPCE